MGFAQLTYRESLRDIETCLRALGPKLYHSGIRSWPARSTLADHSKLDRVSFAQFAATAQIVCMVTDRSDAAERTLIGKHGVHVLVATD
jgi:hypothetical protein